jgi:16S rRNA A1518/A1519 N6-dimethyltransferase RsmA/KsgA/DIM1 with predicted DNA glycosylase/AP lyase activity
VASFRALVEAGFRTRAPSLRAALSRLVPERTFKRLARELGFDASASARDLDVHQWAALFTGLREREASPGRPVRTTR